MRLDPTSEQYLPGVDNALELRVLVVPFVEWLTYPSMYLPTFAVSVTSWLCIARFVCYLLQTASLRYDSLEYGRRTGSEPFPNISRGTEGNRGSVPRVPLESGLLIRCSFWCGCCTLNKRIDARLSTLPPCKCNVFVQCGVPTKNIVATDSCNNTTRRL